MPKPGAHGTDLANFAQHMVDHGARKTQETPRRVRVIHNHMVIADTTKALQVWEHDYYPLYYIAQRDIKNCELTTKRDIYSGGKVLAVVSQLVIPAHDGLDEERTDRVVRFVNDASLGPLADMVRLEFSSMDQWLEEDAPIYVHPKDPFKRVDILPSQRRIEIKVNGRTVADSPTSLHLLETGLPTRYYLPLTTVDQSALRKSNLITKCPYKGEAEYYHVMLDGEQFKDLVWYYRMPTHESAAIAGMVCFYNEKVDVILDGQLQQRPKSIFA